MKHNRPKSKYVSLKRAGALLLAAVLLLSAFSAFAQESDEKVVRIGWYESPFNIMDDDGSRSGYAYEYAQKVAVYAGWKYEYVEGSWPELMQMLADGKIDLMTDVSYTEERSSKMLFSSYPMGTEEYYLFTTPDNRDISTSDYSTFNGKTIGANKGSTQIDYLKAWEKENNIEARLVELTGTESQNLAALTRGDIDLYLTLDAMVDDATTIPICKIASSDFYFAVNKNRPDLLAELNSAMASIQDNNRFYNQQLYNKYLKTTNASTYFNTNELDWLSEHGTIRVGYQDNYLAFCASDPKTGELIGALKDYLETASTCMSNGKLNFEPVAYPTSEAALEALKNGEVDCMFPVNLSDYYGEQGGYSITSSIMNTEMSAVVRASDQKNFSTKDRVTVAVNAGNPNYDMFLIDNFPDWRSIYFKDTPECLKAISQGKADCILISSFRFSNISSLCDRYNLVSVPAGVRMDYCFAVKRGNTELYSILNKVNSTIPESIMNIALNSYYIKDGTNSDFKNYLIENRDFIIASLFIMLSLFLVFLYLSIRSHRKTKEKQELISATESDKLTGLYMKSYFYEYIERIYSEDPLKPMDAIVFNIIQFHSVNAINSRAFGDEVLQAIGAELVAFTEENGGIACRAEADRFAVYCPHFDDYHLLYDRLQNALNSLFSNTSIRLRMGIMPYEKGVEPRQMVEQALIACNMARGLLKEQLLVFDENMHKKEAFEQKLQHDLRNAVANREFEVYYQPIYGIQNDTLQLNGVEALVRWNHPEFGLLVPNDFIPVFEQNGQIDVIDRFVWREAAKQIAIWRDKYSTVIPISINLSRIDVFDPTLESTLNNLLESNGLQPDALTLEITESAYIEDSESFFEIIESLRASGYKIEMDDFGAGYSSLNMLSSMPIDALKMDKAFIDDINISEKRVKLVQLILDIANNLKVPVIAEGVETQSQFELLKGLGCAMAQGYYFSKPLTAAKFEKKIFEKE